MRELLMRKSMHFPRHACVLCQDCTDGTVLHLLLHCNFSKLCWNLNGLQIDNSLSEFQALESIKMQISQPFFMEIIIIRCVGVSGQHETISFLTISLFLFRSARSPSCCKGKVSPGYRHMVSGCFVIFLFFFTFYFSQYFF
jgi:hypothetical protein